MLIIARALSSSKHDVPFHEHMHLKIIASCIRQRCSQPRNCVNHVDNWFGVRANVRLVCPHFVAPAAPGRALRTRWMLLARRREPCVGSMKVSTSKAPQGYHFNNPRRDMPLPFNEPQKTQSDGEFRRVFLCPGQSWYPSWHKGIRACLTWAVRFFRCAVAQRGVRIKDAY